MFRQAGHTPPHQRVARRDENKNLLVGEPCSASRLSLSWPKLLCVLSPLGLACVCGAARAPRAPRARRAAGAMDEELWFGGKVKVDDVVQQRHVDPAGCDVGHHQHLVRVRVGVSQGQG